MQKGLDTYTLVRGMSQDTPAHMPEATPHWWYSRNARFRHGRVRQIGQNFTMMTLPGGDVTDVTNLSGYNTLQVALSGHGLYRLDFGFNTATLIAQPIGFSVDTDGKYRWAVVQSQAGVYYTNPNNPIIRYNGTTAAWNWSSAGPDYKGKYLVNFYGHLVVANVSDGPDSFPLRIAYSDVEQFDIFEPLITNEADFYDIQENPLNAIYGLGITGLQRVGDVLAIFTPGSIYNMRYVGFDNGVMLFTEQIQGIGNWFPHATLAMDRYAVFISNEDFYVYDGSTCVPIGGSIRDYFFETLTEDPFLRNKTFGYIETLKQELRWYYISKDAVIPECDTCLVFNWQTRDWYIEDGRNYTAALNAGGQTARTIDQLDRLSATINGLDTLANTIDSLDAISVWPQSAFSLSGTGQICSEFDLQSGSTGQFELESRDFIVGDVGTFKELDTILIDAEVQLNDKAANDKAVSLTAAPVTGGAALGLKFGWSVYVSVRNYVREPVTFFFAGVWDGSEPELKLTRARISGRIFRFKFISTGLWGCQFFGFSPNFNAGTSEN